MSILFRFGNHLITESGHTLVQDHIPGTVILIIIGHVFSLSKKCDENVIDV